jgi:hypothetical protein
MKVGSTTRFKKGSRCLNCKKVLDSATGLDSDETPSPGDLTVCLTCGHLMVFNEKLKFRELSDEEIVETAGDPRIVKFQNVRARVLERMRKEDKNIEIILRKFNKSKETRQQRRSRERKPK